MMDVTCLRRGVLALCVLLLSVAATEGRRYMVGPWYDPATGDFWGCLTEDTLGANQLIMQADSYADCTPGRVVEDEARIHGALTSSGVIGEAPELERWTFGVRALSIAASFLAFHHPDPAVFDELFDGLRIGETFGVRVTKRGLVALDVYGKRWELFYE